MSTDEMICARCQSAPRTSGDLCQRCIDERAILFGRMEGKPKNKPNQLMQTRAQLAAANERVKALKILLHRWCYLNETPETHAPNAFIDLYNETTAALKGEADAT